LEAGGWKPTPASTQNACCAHRSCGVAINITLSIDERVVAQARLAAQDMGKSLNQAVRDHLEQSWPGARRSNPRSALASNRRRTRRAACAAGSAGQTSCSAVRSFIGTNVFVCADAADAADKPAQGARSAATGDTVVRLECAICCKRPAGMRARALPTSVMCFARASSPSRTRGQVAQLAESRSAEGATTTSPRGRGRQGLLQGGQAEVLAARFRPISDVRGRELVALERSVAHAAKPPKVTSG
jgi:hypothetical protein